MGLAAIVIVVVIGQGWGWGLSLVVVVIGRLGVAAVIVSLEVAGARGIVVRGKNWAWEEAAVVASHRRTVLKKKNQR